MSIKEIKQKRPTILTIYPRSNCLAYASMHESTSTIRTRRCYFNSRCNKENLEHVRKTLKYLRPDVVVLRDYKHGLDPKESRIKKLLDSITRETKKLGFKLFIYTREDIRKTFWHFGGHRKCEIALQIAEWHPEFKDRVPPRKVYEQESIEGYPFLQTTILCNY